MTEHETGFAIIQEHLHPFLCTSPVRFAMMLKNNWMGSMWKVQARRRGDVYIVPRDIMSGVKISLHASGQQHLKVDRPPLPPLRMKWKEPPMESPLPASFKIIFTFWSAGMGSTKDYDVARLTRMWEDNHVFIQGEDRENCVITVCFFLTPHDASVELPSWPPMETIAILSLRTGKDLHIIVRKERRNNVRDAIEKELTKVVESGGVSAYSKNPKQSLLLLGGKDVDGCPYVAPVSVETTEKGVGLLRCRHVRVQPPPIVR